MPNIVYLNGEFIAKSNAKISVLDRGFLFGDGIYEVIPVYQGKPFRLSEHLSRLNDCLNKVKIKNPYVEKQWQSLIEQVIAKNNEQNTSVYIQVSRGFQQERNHVATSAVKPTVLVMTSPLSSGNYELKPIKATLLDDIRWKHCDIKSIALLGNILLRQEAEARGCQEAILHRKQKVTEGATSNVFIVKSGVIYTPEKNQYILGGITRDLIIELAKKASIKVIETQISTDELFAADEVWVSSSSREISPVTQIDDKIIAQGEIGSITKKLHSDFQAFKQTLIND